MTASLSRGRSVARAAAALVAAGTLALSGCANYATLDSYTPAVGVNVDAPSVKIRNLLIISDASGAGKLSGALVGSESDTLTAVAGVPIKLDNVEGEALTFAKVSVPVVAGQLTKLDEAGVTVSGADLQPGLSADLVLTFTKIGDITVTVPVVSSDHPDFSDEG